MSVKNDKGISPNNESSFNMITHVLKRSETIQGDKVSGNNNYEPIFHKPVTTEPVVKLWGELRRGAVSDHSFSSSTEGDYTDQTATLFKQALDGIKALYGNISRLINKGAHHDAEKKEMLSRLKKTEEALEKAHNFYLQGQDNKALDSTEDASNTPSNNA